MPGPMNRIAAATTGGGAVTTATAGVFMDLLAEPETVAAFGLSQGEWAAVGVIGGMAVGVLGLVMQAFFLWRRDRRETHRHMRAGDTRPHYHRRRDDPKPPEDA